jgi:hypothetical protein
MSKVVYGIFSQPADAEAMAEELNRRGGQIYAVAHMHGVREEEVQYPATLALRNGILTGVVVGGLAGFMIWAVLWPMHGMMLGPSALGLLVIASSLFGLVAGAVAGASECKPQLVDAAERAEAEGRVIVTCEAPAEDIEAIGVRMQEGGARLVEAA